MPRIAKNRLNLTKSAVEGLTAPGTYYDEKQQGLVLYVSPQGAKSWGVYKWHPVLKRPISKSVGKWPAYTTEAARLKAREIVHALDRGELDEPKRKETLGDLDDRYALALKATGARLYNYISDVIRLGAEDWRKRPADSITRAMIEERHNLISATRGANAAMKFVKGLNTIYKHADMPSPAAKVRVARFQPRDRVASPSELEALQAEIDRRPPLWRDYFNLVILTGARRSNVASMRFEDVRDGVWTIPGDQAKKKKAIVLPLVPEAAAIIEARRAVQRTGYVFPTRSAKGYVAQPWEQWDEIRKAAGVAGITIHDMRRTLLSRMANAGINPAIAAAAAGHSDIKTTLRVYSVVTQASVLEALRKVTPSQGIAG